MNESVVALVKREKPALPNEFISMPGDLSLHIVQDGRLETPPGAQAD